MEVGRTYCRCGRYSESVREPSLHMKIFFNQIRAMIYIQIRLRSSKSAKVENANNDFVICSVFTKNVVR